MSYDKLFVEVNGEKRKCFNLTKTLKKKQTNNTLTQIPEQQRQEVLPTSKKR